MDIRSVEVVVEKGSDRYIHPSKGLPAIKPGIVNIKDFIGADRVPTGLYRQFASIFSNTIAESILQEWVIYQYTDENVTGTFYLPLKIFIDHTSYL